jgi:preprotein translocase subunit SecE
MADKTNAPVPKDGRKVSWFEGLKSEFSKIVWPDRNTLIRQTIAVTAVSIILGLVIAIVDAIIKHGIVDVVINL